MFYMGGAPRIPEGYFNPCELFSRTRVGEDDGVDNDEDGQSNGSIDGDVLQVSNIENARAVEDSNAIISSHEIHPKYIFKPKPLEKNSGPTQDTDYGESKDSAGRGGGRGCAGNRGLIAQNHDKSRLILYIVALRTHILLALSTKKLDQYYKMAWS